MAVKYTDGKNIYYVSGILGENNFAVCKESLILNLLVIINIKAVLIKLFIQQVKHKII